MGETTYVCEGAGALFMFITYPCPIALVSNRTQSKGNQIIAGLLHSLTQPDVFSAYVISPQK
jgi:hypothetical protein